MLRHKLAALIGVLAIFSTVSLFGGVAQAQTYPPGTSVPPPCVPGNASAGNVAVGQSVTFTLCGDFTGTTTVSVNGAVVLTKTATNGAVVVVVTVVSQSVLSVGDPVNVAAVCGTNGIVATGSGTPGRSTGTFDLVCTPTTTAKSGLAFTGANILRSVLIALALIIVGALMIIFQRRRRQTI
jgi:hypothetical protein